MQLEVKGTRCFIHPVDKCADRIAEGGHLILWCNDRSSNLWIDSYDVRSLLSMKLDFPRRTNVSSTESLDQRLEGLGDDAFIELVYERFRSLLEPNSDAATTDDDNSSSSYSANEVPSNSLQSNDLQEQDPTLADSKSEVYQSNRQEYWTTRPSYKEEYEVSRIISERADLQLPDTLKQYQILLHTCRSVRQHRTGPQLEILLRLKHADQNENFDFLLPESPLFTLYTFLKELSDAEFWAVLLGKDRCPAASDNDIDKKEELSCTTGEVVSTVITAVAPAVAKSSQAVSNQKATVSQNALSILGSAYADDISDDEVENNNSSKSSAVDATAASTNIDAPITSADDEQSIASAVAAVVDSSASVPIFATEATESPAKAAAESTTAVTATTTGATTATAQGHHSGNTVATAVELALDANDSDEDLLDADVDAAAGLFWASHHAAKLSKLQNMRKAQRLQRARALKQQLLRGSVRSNGDNSSSSMIEEQDVAVETSQEKKKRRREEVDVC